MIRNSALMKKLVVVVLTIGFCSGFLFKKEAYARMSLNELLARIEALEGTVAEQDAIIEGLNYKLSKVNFDGETMQFEGVNVQIIDGSGDTFGDVNGLGNLIVGYNELKSSNNVRTGSHNIVVGRANNYSSYAGLVVGALNTLSGDHASISGYGCTASGSYSNVSGGWDNEARGKCSSVSGGQWNIAEGEISSVSGGRSNLASAKGASVSGGNDNTASGNYSSVSGGQWNIAEGEISSVDGGQSNIAIAKGASVNAGYNNAARGDYSSLLGGQNTEIFGEYNVFP